MTIELFGNLVPIWQVYLSIGLALVVVEIFIPGLILLPVGIAFVLTSIFSIWVHLLPLQLTFLAVMLLIVFFCFRKFIHAQRQQPSIATNVDSMIGKEAVVEETIDSSKNTGYVKLYGDSWKAICLYEDRLEKGERVIIEKIDGNKVIVRKRK